MKSENEQLTYLKYGTGSIKKQKKQIRHVRPLLTIELMGMPGSGKSTCVRHICEWLCKKKTLILSNEDVTVESIDEKYDFNRKIISNLKAAYSKHSGILVLDRGIRDMALWLNVHSKVARCYNVEHSLSPKACTELAASLPECENDDSYYTILFLQPAALSAQRRMIHRHAADDWAITDVYLTELEKAYRETERVRGRNTYVIRSNELTLDNLVVEFEKILGDILKHETIKQCYGEDEKEIQQLDGAFARYVKPCVR